MTDRISGRSVSRWLREMHQDPMGELERGIDNAAYDIRTLAVDTPMHKKTRERLYAISADLELLARAVRHVVDD